jgi:hypothetical protein
MKNQYVEDGSTSWFVVTKLPNGKYESNIHYANNEERLTMLEAISKYLDEKVIEISSRI